MLCNAVGGGGVSFPRKKRYEGVQFRVGIDLIKLIKSLIKSIRFFQDYKVHM